MEISERISEGGLPAVEANLRGMASDPASGAEEPQSAKAEPIQSAPDLKSGQTGPRIEGHEANERSEPNEPNGWNGEADGLGRGEYGL